MRRSSERFPGRAGSHWCYMTTMGAEPARQSSVVKSSGTSGADAASAQTR